MTLPGDRENLSVIPAKAGIYGFTSARIHKNATPMNRTGFALLDFTAPVGDTCQRPQIESKRSAEEVRSYAS